MALTRCRPPTGCLFPRTPMTDIPNAGPPTRRAAIPRTVPPLRPSAVAATYYNEYEAYPAQWLRNLMAAGLIPQGEVDERSIRDVRPDDLKGFTSCHFFAGLGGWPYALRLAGWPDDRPVWTGSCPCQPFSVAGQRKGFDDDRDLWPVWRGLIAERRPSVVFGEQVASASQWLARARGDLEALGFAVGAVPIEAACVGAPHKRDRYWFVADAEHTGEGRGRILGPGQGAGAYGERPSDQLAGSGDGGHGQLADAERERARRGIAAEGRSRDTRPDDARQLPPATWQAGGGDDVAAAGDGGGIAGPDGMEHASGERRGERRPEHDVRSGRDATTGAGFWDGAVWLTGADGKQRRVEPGVRLLVDGLPARIPKLRALGNAIVPAVGAAFVKAYMDCRP